MSQSSTLTQLGYRMPAEWEPHVATLLSWPHNPDTWPDKPIPTSVWAEMALHLHKAEKVHINVNHAEMQKEAESLLKKLGVDLNQIVFENFPTDDCWMRDCGPIFVKNKTGLAITDWLFNKWGGKYPPWEQDNHIPEKFSDKYHIDRFTIDVVMEGGSIDVNGLGSLLTTESCLLNKNRNSHLSKKEIEQVLKDHLGVSNILWLGEGIVGDDTDGHVDDITRFVGPHTIVTAVEDDPLDENFKPLQENLKRLQLMKDEQGRPFEILTLPMPGALFCDNQRLPASYANFYIGNGAVLVPTYRHANDKKALDVLQKFFPNRKVVGIDSTNLVWGLGSFHCVTQQWPK